MLYTSISECTNEEEMNENFMKNSRVFKNE